MLTGTSLSLCVHDVVIGKVKLEHVDRIVAKTAFRPLASSFESIWDCYAMRGEWHFLNDNNLHDETKKVFNQLLPIIEQPRLQGKFLYRYQDEATWLTTEGHYPVFGGRVYEDHL